MGILDKIIKKDKKAKPEKKINEINETDKNEIEQKKINVKSGKETERKDKTDKKPSKNKRKINKVSTAKKVAKENLPSHYFDVIKKPHISEKALGLSEKRKYVFKISTSANKTEIKKAVEGLYKVSVESVNIIKAPEKPKRFKGVLGTKSGYKKAIVTLADGNTIDVMGGA